MSNGRKNLLLEFSSLMGLRFRDLDLLDLAFHHRSCSNEDPRFKGRNNERLEFLGDSVLGLSCASYLFLELKGKTEGDLSKIKASVVSEPILAKIAVGKLSIEKYLVLGRGEELSGGRNKPAILADAVEAVIGAIYLDQGFETARKFVLDLIVPEIDSVLNDSGSKDYKSLLQNYYQKKHNECPSYELVRMEGPDHNRTFYVSCHLGKVSYGPASGKNKKLAEQAAARMAYIAICGN